MSTDYRDSITNLHRGVHSDMDSACTRLHEAIDLLEQANLTAAVADLRGVEQRLAEAVRR
ncbi:hypothetical protein [Gordonia effusa]|nr:hypothetical protein [Gordonia effusa]